MDPLRQKQRASLWIAGVAALLALFAGGGVTPVPAISGAWVWGFHPLVIALGAWAGALTVVRNRDIERHRWELVQDPMLTRGEREWAHKEAEAERKRSAASFLASPLLIAGWLAYSLQEGAAPLASDLMPASALVGFGLGLGLAHLRGPGEEGAPTDPGQEGAREPPPPLR